MPHDTIFIQQLRLNAIIGVYPEERVTPQPLLLDLELTTDIRPAAATDALTDTLDYQQLTDNLVTWTAQKPCQLVETLAHYLAEQVLRTTPALAVRLRLTKYPPGIAAAGVGVVVERSQGQNLP